MFFCLVVCSALLSAALELPDEPAFTELGMGRCLDASGREPQVRCEASSAEFAALDEDDGSDCGCGELGSLCQAFAKSSFKKGRCVLYGEDARMGALKLNGWKCRPSNVVDQAPLPVVSSNRRKGWGCFVKVERCELRFDVPYNLSWSEVGCHARFHAVTRSPRALGQLLSHDDDNATLHTKLTLRHDIESLEHLATKGRLPERFADAPAAFRSLLAALPPALAPEVHFSVKPGLIAKEEHEALWRMLQSRSVHVEAGLQTMESLLAEPSPAAHAADEDTFWRNAGELGKSSSCSLDEGWVVIDNLLTPSALERIREIIEDSSIFQEVYDGGRYLAAGPAGGLYMPIFQQLARELQLAFPRLLGPHCLVNYWAFKFDNTEERQGGVGIHHDEAALNANLWLVPKEDIAAVDAGKQQNGLLVYQAELPGRDRTDEPYAEGRSRRHNLTRGVPRLAVAYEANRLTIFKSGYLHESMQLSARPGYRNRRINLTFLFGAPCVNGSPDIVSERASTSKAAYEL